MHAICVKGLVFNNSISNVSVEVYFNQWHRTQPPAFAAVFIHGLMCCTLCLSVSKALSGESAVLASYRPAFYLFIEMCPLAALTQKCRRMFTAFTEYGRSFSWARKHPELRLRSVEIRW